jgi:hypothetical protein
MLVRLRYEIKMKKNAMLQVIRWRKNETERREEIRRARLEAAKWVE